MFQSCTRNLGSCGSKVKQQLFGTTKVDLWPHMVGIGAGVSGEVGTEGLSKVPSINYPSTQPINTFGAAGSASADYYAPAPWEGNGEDVLIASAGGFARNEQPITVATKGSIVGPVTIPPGWVSSSDQPALTPGHDPQFAVGASACACVHGNLTNATNDTQLQGGFTTYSLSFGAPVNIGLQFSVGRDARTGQGIFNFNFGFGGGYSAAVYDTYTQSPWWTAPSTGLRPINAS